jgi:hypothetical protein
MEPPLVSFEDEYLRRDLDDSVDDMAGLGEIRGTQARIGSVSLDFSIRGYLDVARAIRLELPPLRPIQDWELHRRDHAARGIAAAEALEAAVDREVPGLRLRAHAALEPDYSTAGPGAAVPPLLALALGDDPIGRLAAYVELAAGARKVINWLRSRGVEALSVDNGVAMLLAWHDVPPPRIAMSDLVR